MPMTPGKDETRSDFLDRCISEMSDKHPDWEQDQLVAACSSMYREAKSKSFRSSDRNLEHLHKVLPQDGVEQWCSFANEAAAEGMPHNEAVQFAWNAMRDDGWRRPETGKGKRWSKQKHKGTSGEVLCKIVKVDDEQRMVYGWASVITERGIPVVDYQGDIIEAPELVEATTEFMKDARIAKQMHDGGQVGEVLHSFPLVFEIMKSLGIKCDKEGWIVGVYVRDDDVWAKVKSGELPAFSIGGTAYDEAA